MAEEIDRGDYVEVRDSGAEWSSVGYRPKPGTPEHNRRALTARVEQAIEELGQSRDALAATAPTNAVVLTAVRRCVSVSLALARLVAGRLEAP